MSKKLATCLLALVLLPLGLLGWMGVRASADDEMRVRQQLRDVLLGRLRDMRSHVVRAIEQVERELLRGFDKSEQRTRKVKQRRPSSSARSFSTSQRKVRGRAASPEVQAARTKRQVGALYQWQRRTPLARQVFWLNKRGTMLYPDPRLPRAQLRQEEWAFLQRTRAIWERRAILSQPRQQGNRSEQQNPRSAGSSGPTAAARAAPKRPKWRKQRKQRQVPPSSAPPQSNTNLSPRGDLIQQLRRSLQSFKVPMPPLQKRALSVSSLQRQPPQRRGLGDSIVNIAADRGHGWIVWYWAEGLHLLFWKRLTSGGVVGVEVDRIVLMSRLVGILPGTSSQPKKQQGQMLLVDDKSTPIYQWGLYQAKPKEAPLARLFLAYPLHAWQLVYFGPERQQFSSLARRIHIQMLVLLSVVACILILIAVYLYREYSRDMRDAAQRMTFVTQVSHELKTPLTNIRLYAELLEAKIPEEQPRSRRHVKVIVSESQRLSRLINNILTFARQRRSSLKLRPTTTDIDALLQRIVEQFRPSLEEAGLTIELDGDAPLPAWADPDAVEQILGNLISNVKKYAASGQWLGLSSRQDEDGTTHIEVADRGPGVASGMRQEIFQPFVRCSDKLSDGVAGTGIGLTIARELAWMLGGELAFVTSEAEGACFRLTLPSKT